jgi:phosphohistidine phosphatase
MKLILIRHAKAGERDPRLYPDDDLRPIDPIGRAEQERVSRALARMDLGIEYLISSPLARAAQTAEITARELGLESRLEYVDELASRYSVEALVERLARFPEDAVVAAVGHEPHLGRFAAAMLHADGEIALRIDKSAVLALEFEGPAVPGKGELLFLLPARTVLRIQS